MARNKMSVLQLTFLTALNMMDSGIIMLPAKIADVGMISLLGWAFTIVGVIALTYSFAKCGMLTARTGGLGGFATYAFGEAGSFLTNLTYAIALLISCLFIAAHPPRKGCSPLFRQKHGQTVLSLVNIRRSCRPTSNVLLRSPMRCRASQQTESQQDSCSFQTVIPRVYPESRYNVILLGRLGRPFSFSAVH
ncbi:MAG: hypothetical protein ACI4SY_00160 [Sutterella sp.]